VTGHEKNSKVSRWGLVICALLVTVLFSGLASTGAFHRADAVVWDLGQRLRPNPARASQVTLVLIDEGDLQRYGPWPFDRSIYATLIEKLISAGALGVGFDVLLQDPATAAPEGDRVLVKEVRRHPQQVVFPFNYEKSPVMTGTNTLRARTIIVEPFAALRDALVHRGYVNVDVTDANPDGVLRWYYPRRRLKGKLESSFALVLASLAGVMPTMYAPDEPRQLWYRSRSAFARMSVREVFESDEGFDLADSLVLVGASAPQMMDLKVTPIGPMPGVELNANALACMLEGNWGRSLSRPMRCGVVFLFGIMAMGASSVFSPVLAMGIILLGCVAWGGLVLLAMAISGISLPLLAPQLCAIVSGTLWGLSRTAGGSGDVEVREVIDAQTVFIRARQSLAEGEATEGLALLQRLDDRTGEASSLICQCLARMGESRLLEMRLDEAMTVGRDLLYELALVLDEEGYLTMARGALEAIYCKDIGYRDVEERLVILRKRAQRGELVVNVRGVRELLGSRFSRLRHLADGTMGVLFVAYDARLERQVVVKVLHPYLLKNETALKRFMREVRLLTSLDHPNIIRVFELEKGKAPYYTMEYCEGASLYELLRDGKVSCSQVIPIACAIAGALECAHSRGIVHRDLKPDNVLIGEDGSVKVSDFGIAKDQFGPGLTKAGEVLGTRGYMAPEQAQGEQVGPSADWYSFGVVLDELHKAGGTTIAGVDELVHDLCVEDAGDRATGVVGRLAELSASR